MLSLDNIEKLVTLLLAEALVRGGGVGFDILLCSYSCVTWGMDELDTADEVKESQRLRHNEEKD